jgi:hypothetical protein
MTGIGFGVARETARPWLRWVAPVAGYLAAAFLHFVWNGAATVSGLLTLVMLPLWFLFVVFFVAIVVALVFRKGRIIKDHLKDEVLIGTISPQELEMICSPFGRWKARMSYGGAVGRDFVAAAARLGLCKWHTARAMKGQKRTVSMDFIAPLRQELARLRQEVYAKLGRPMPQPAYGPYAPPQAGYGQKDPQGGYGQRPPPGPQGPAGGGPWGPPR